VVSRPSKWGNPYRIEMVPSRSRTEAVGRYRRALEDDDGTLPFTSSDVRRQLAGRDLACWCPLDQPCHADVLLEVANERVARRGTDDRQD
jgi:hypothetical protein